MTQRWMHGPQHGDGMEMMIFMRRTVVAVTQGVHILQLLDMSGY